MLSFCQITPTALLRLIGTPDAPIILDVRLAEDRDADPFSIPTAQALDYRSAASFGPTERRVVVVCHKGLKLSEGAAALLRSRGIAAEGLEGGHVAWRNEGLPVVPDALVAKSNLWVTRHRPKIDRIACPWLIRRFIAPDARFLFVAPSQVLAVAERFSAVSFDIEGADYTHAADQCTFDALLTAYSLDFPALKRVADVVRAADTDRHDLSPQAAGLLAVSVGLSRMFKDDLAQLEAGMTLYDALYRWARDGYEEGHDWPQGRAQ